MQTIFHTYRVDKEWRVSKAPGAIVVIWLSYKESKRTELSPMKLSFPTQVMRLLLNILREKKNIAMEIKYQPIHFVYLRTKIMPFCKCVAFITVCWTRLPAIRNCYGHILRMCKNKMLRVGNDCKHKKHNESDTDLQPHLTRVECFPSM